MAFTRSQLLIGLVIVTAIASGMGLLASAVSRAKSEARRSSDL